MKKRFLILLIFLTCVLILFLVFSKNKKNITGDSLVFTPTRQPTKGVEETYPVAEFKQRITKKPFGVYITPKNSPVEPERFQGFHTGVDVEYEDISEDVPVFAVCDGEIVKAGWVSGYGGMIGLKCQISSIDYYVIYGHLRVSSINKNSKVLKGDQLAVLGEGKTKETDFERKHLHFGIHKGSIDLRGYVQNQNELNEWVSPLIVIF